VRTPASGVQSNPSGPQQAPGAGGQNQAWRHFDSGLTQGRPQGQSPVQTQFQTQSPTGQSQGQSQAPARGTLASPAGKGGATMPANSDSSGWRHFSNSAPAQSGGANGHSPERSVPSSVSSPSPAGSSNVPSSSVQRPGTSAGPGASTNDNGWRHFTPQPTVDRVNSGSGMNAGRDSGSFPAHNEISRPQSESSAGRSMVQDSPRNYSRPPLEMRQPIVTQRAPESRGSAPAQAAPSHSGGGGGGGGNRGGGGSGGGNHGGSGGGPHGGSGRH
jgi:hypothetical protein